MWNDRKDKGKWKKEVVKLITHRRVMSVYFSISVGFIWGLFNLEQPLELPLWFG